MDANLPLGPAVVEGTLPAFKAAFIQHGDDGAVEFRGAGLGTTYGPADTARCVHVAEHVPPHPGCACGFYAFHDRVDAMALLTDRLVAILDVGLFGRFHEYERGIIAAAQVVEGVTLSPWCSRCLVKGSLEEADALVGRPMAVDRVLVPACAKHIEKGATVLGLVDLSQALGVKVAWADGDDPISNVAFRDLKTLRPTPLRTLPGVDDLLPGEVAHIFADAVAEDDQGNLWIDPTARLIQPLPGTDVPIRLADDGTHEVLLEGVCVTGWRSAGDHARFALSVRAIGEPQAPLPPDGRGHAKEASNAGL